MVARPTYAALAAVFLLAACGKGEQAPREQARVQTTSHGLQMVPGWIAGSGWPSDTVVALRSIHFRKGTSIVGNVSVITESSPPYLSTEQAVLGDSAEVRGTLTAHSLRLRDGAHIVGPASYNQLASVGVIDGPVTTPLTLPLPITVPAVSDFTAGSQGIEVASSQTQTLAPGSYGDVLLRAGSAATNTVLRLSGGTYQFGTIDANDRSRIECMAACEIHVKGQLRASARTYVGPSGMSGLQIGAMQIFVEGANQGGGGPEGSPAAGQFGDNSELKAFIFVPNGTIHLRSGSRSVGKFVARDILLGDGAEVADGTGVVVLPDSWVTGPHWPERTLVALNSFDLNASAQLTGDVAAILASSGPTLVSGFEGHVGADARVTGNVTADTLRIRSGAQVGEASFNSATNNGTVQGQLRTPLDVPVDISVPSFPLIVAGTTTVDVPARADQALAAGSYGLIKLRAGVNNDKTVLTLSGGIYQIADLEIGDHGRVECAAPCELRVKNRISPGTNSYLGPVAGSALDLANIRVFVEGKNAGNGGPGSTPYAAVFGQTNTVQAFVFVPNGTLQLRNGGAATGRFVAKDALIGDGTTVAKGGTTALPPVIQTQPSSVSVSAGQAATFQVIASGTDVTFQWFRNGNVIDGATGASYTLTSTALADSGSSFYVVVTNSIGVSVTSATAVLTVTAVPPAITTEPADVTAGVGEPIQLTCAANGTDVVYQWRKNGANIGGATLPSFQIASAAFQDAGVYRCVASNSSGSAMSREATVVVEVRPPSILEHPDDLSVRIGQAAAFSVVASGVDLTYQWQRGLENIAGQTSATLTLPSVVLTDNGATFRCVVTSPLGQAVSASAALTVIDDRPVSLVVDGPATRTVDVDQIAITGTATAGGNGAVTVEILSDRYSGQRFAGTRATDGTFRIAAPLELGVNVLRVIASDSANHSSEQTVRVTFTPALAPSVRITTPLDGAIIVEPTIDVAGTVYSSLPREQLRLELNGAVVFPSGSNGQFSFVFEDVALTLGTNQLLVALITPLGRQTAERIVVYQPEPPPDQGSPPRIRINGAASNVFSTGSDLVVSGDIDADRCVDEVTINGQAARIIGSGASVSFDRSVAFGSAASVAIVVRATDCDGRSAELSYRAWRDVTTPMLAVTGLQPSSPGNPVVNSVSGNPYRLEGTVTEANLAGLTLNAQSLYVTPAAGVNTWSFAVDVELARGEERSLLIEAWDFAGNQSSAHVILRLDSTVDIEIVSPRDGAQLALPSGANVDVTVRAPGLGAADVLTARLDAAAPALMTRAGTTAAVALPAAAGSHRLTVEARAGTTLLASRSVSFTTIDAANVPLEVVRQEPANGASGVEPNTFVALHFNRPIDPARLQVRLFQTAHGMQYVTPDEAQDLRTLSVVELEQVSFDRDQVAGGLSFVPENVMAAFYPAVDLAFGGTIYVEVDYEGASLARSSFAVRPLPTFVQGIVANQFGSALPDIKVSIPQLGLETTTDEHGAYGFGFGVPADRALPAGVHHVVVNAGLADHRYGSAELLVAAEQGRLTGVPSVIIPELHRGEPFRFIASGGSAALAGDELILDLGSAQLTFPDGQASGPVHAQFHRLDQVVVGVSPGIMPPWMYGIQPAGIEVRGTVGITLHLPSRAGSYAYLTGVAAAEYVLLVGRDRESLMLEPVGVGRFDAATNVLQSVRPTALERLDYVGYAEVTPEQIVLLQRYAAGELSLQALKTQIQAAVNP